MSLMVTHSMNSDGDSSVFSITTHLLSRGFAGTVAARQLPSVLHGPRLGINRGCLRIQTRKNTPRVVVWCSWLCEHRWCTAAAQYLARLTNRGCLRIQTRKNTPRVVVWCSSSCSTAEAVNGTGLPECHQTGWQNLQQSMLQLLHDIMPSRWNQRILTH